MPREMIRVRCDCVAARDAKWDLAAGEEDRQLGLGRLEQTFDGTGVEQASLERFLPATNRGYALLKKLGWREQTGLGKKADGRLQPVAMAEQYATLGLGKASEYDTKVGIASPIISRACPQSSRTYPSHILQIAFRYPSDTLHTSRTSPSHLYCLCLPCYTYSTLLPELARPKMRPRVARR